MAIKRLQMRRDTASNWTSNNPTLLAGEMGVETDTLQEQMEPMDKVFQLVVLQTRF